MSGYNKVLCTVRTVGAVVSLCTEYVDYRIHTLQRYTEEI